MFVADSDWIISSVVRDSDDRLDKLGYERLNTRLQVLLNAGYMYLFWLQLVMPALA